jgi:hypothetical protein
VHPILKLIEALPDGVGQSELVPIFENVLDEGSLSALQVATALAECADKLWHTYDEPMPPETIRWRLIGRCRDLLSSPDEEVVEVTLATVSPLRLVDLLPDLDRMASDLQRSPALRANFALAVSTLRTDPDPYSSLRRFQSPAGPALLADLIFNVSSRKARRSDAESERSTAVLRCPPWRPRATPCSCPQPSCQVGERRLRWPELVSLRQHDVRFPR